MHFNIMWQHLTDAYENNQPHQCHIHLHRHRQTDRQTDRQTHRHTDTQTYRQTDRHTDRQTQTDRQPHTHTHTHISSSLQCRTTIWISDDLTLCFEQLIVTGTVGIVAGKNRTQCPVSKWLLAIHISNRVNQCVIWVWNTAKMGVWMWQGSEATAASSAIRFITTSRWIWTRRPDLVQVTVPST